MPFQAAEGGLTQEVENFALAHAGGRLDLLVQLHERDLQALGQRRAQGTFAGPAQADQGDTALLPAARRVTLAQMDMQVRQLGTGTGTECGQSSLNPGQFR